MNEEVQAEQLAETDDLFDDYAEDTGADPETGSGEETQASEEGWQETGTAENEGQEEEHFDLTDETGSSRRVTRSEMEQLAKRGMQYDRMSMQVTGLQQERDNLARYRQENDSTLSDIKQLADMAGVDVATYLTALQENVLVSKGMNRDEAKLWVQRQREQAQKQAAEANQRRQQADAARQRQEADIQEFVRRYQQVDPKTIPQSVWDDVRRGESLVNAYGRYEVQRLKEENQKLQQQLGIKEKNDKNKANAVGSVQTAGSKERSDAFMSGFDSI